MSAPFIVRGSVVRLKSGGPMMLALGMVGMVGGVSDCWLCCWATNYENPCAGFEVFQAVTLEVVITAPGMAT